MKNPYFSGTQQALATKASSEQEYDNLNKALASIGASFGKYPTQIRSGFLSNLSTYAPSISSGIENYIDSNRETEELNRNAILKKQELEAEIAKEAQENFWKQRQLELREANVNDQMNYRAMRLALEKAKLDQGEVNNALDSKYSYLDEIAPMMRTPSAFDKASSKAEGSREFLAHIQKLGKNYDELKKAMVDAGINVTNPLAFNKAINDLNNWASSVTKNPKRRAIATAYAATRAAAKNVAQEAEQIRKKGALTDFLVKYADENYLYPSLGVENYDIFEKKYKDMLEDAQEAYDVNALSRKLGRHMDRDTYREAKRLIDEREGKIVAPPTIDPGESVPAPAVTVKMRFPSGTIRDVPRDMIDKAGSIGGILLND